MFQFAGPIMASRGDRILCTVMFEDEKVNDGKVPVSFFLNGRKIITKKGEDRFFVDSRHDRPLHPYIGMTDGCSALAKVRSKMVLDSQKAN